jgi:uncharacterized cupin superfamily protein
MLNAEEIKVLYNTENVDHIKRRKCVQKDKGYDRAFKIKVAETAIRLGNKKSAEKFGMNIDTVRVWVSSRKRGSL